MIEQVFSCCAIRSGQFGDEAQSREVVGNRLFSSATMRENRSNYEIDAEPRF